MGGVTALYEFANGLSRRGHQVHITHAAFWNRPGIESLADLAWFRFEPHIVHHVVTDGEIRLPPADIIFGTTAGPEMGLPVQIVQGFQMFPPEMERAVFRTPCLKVCVASWLMRVGSAEFGVPLDQFVHVPMGIDHDTFRVTRPLDVRDLRVGMLYNSHLAKGWVTGRRALERVHERMPEMRAIVFGTETPTEALPSWMTFVSDPPARVLVEDVYNQCRVFVQPSLWEGFGFTAVEAMACGAALVSTDNGGSEDYAMHGRTALVSPPGEFEPLADHVEALLRDDGERLRLVAAGREHVAGFSWDRGAELLEGHLERYLADPATFQRPPIADAVESETSIRR
jgi:L-malate glycosyltransferase